MVGLILQEIEHALSFVEGADLALLLIDQVHVLQPQTVLADARLHQDRDHRLAVEVTEACEDLVVDVLVHVDVHQERLQLAMDIRLIR